MRCSRRGPSTWAGAFGPPHVPAWTRGRLSWVQQNYIRAETLTKANARLVDYQAELPLVEVWAMARWPRPTARRVIDLYEDVQRHTLATGKRPPEVFSTELTRLQKRIIRLSGIPRPYSE